MKEKLIAAGVNNLREFGYSNCNAENILTDDIYKEFFSRMLNDNKGRGADEEINELLVIIKNA